MLSTQAPATPVRTRVLARRRAVPSSASTAVAAAAAAVRRRTASACNGGGEGSLSGCQLTSVTTLVDAASKQNQLKAFAAAMTKPVSSLECRRSFDLLRALLPQRFAELCKVHLSFLIDVPADFLDSEPDDPRGSRRGNQHQTPGRWLRQQVRNSMKIKVQTGKSETDGSSAEIPQPTAAASIISGDLALVESLLSLLSGHAGTVEGLFRKCGSASRQRHLMEALRAAAGTGPVTAAAATAAAAAAGCSAHDIAGALKSSLANLAEPLLTNRLLPYFQQVGRLGAQNLPAAADSSDSADTAASGVQPDEGRAALLSARRLKGFRLLVQLLPADRRVVLSRLLALLARTGSAPDTRMTPGSLGTVFGPALLYPRVDPATSGARETAETLNSAVAFLIQHSEAVMMIPDSIAQDADQILRTIRRSPAASLAATAASAAASAPSEEVVSLSVRFAESSVSSRLRHREDFTRSQVAALYAAVQAMPDSAKRRRLIRRFNRTNGGLPTAEGPIAGAKAEQLRPVLPSSPSPNSILSTSASSTSPRSPPQSHPPSPSPLISSPVFGSRVLLDFPMRCLSPAPDM